MNRYVRKTNICCIVRNNILPKDSPRAEVGGATSPAVSATPERGVPINVQNVPEPVAPVTYDTTDNLCRSEVILRDSHRQNYGSYPSEAGEAEASVSSTNFRVGRDGSRRQMPLLPQKLLTVRLSDFDIPFPSHMKLQIARARGAKKSLLTIVPGRRTRRRSVGHSAGHPSVVRRAFCVNPDIGQADGGKRRRNPPCTMRQARRALRPKRQVNLPPLKVYHIVPTSRLLAVSSDAVYRRSAVGGLCSRQFPQRMGRERDGRMSSYNAC